jgi:hypothetical protein
MRVAARISILTAGLIQTAAGLLHVHAEGAVSGGQAESSQACEAGEQGRGSAEEPAPRACTADEHDTHAVAASGANMTLVFLLCRLWSLARTISA